MGYFVLVLSGFASGLLAGLLGIGGGTLIVPILIALGYVPIQAVATSGLAIAITAASGTWQNWRAGYLDMQKVLAIALPSLLTAQLGAYLADWFADYWLMGLFGLLMVINIFLGLLQRRLIQKSKQSNHENLAEQNLDNPEDLLTITENAEQPVIPSKTTAKVVISRLITGGLAGILAGLFGVGGGVIMVPLQMWLLNEPIKKAVQTSLGVVVLTSISAVVGHFFRGNILLLDGFVLGGSGAIAAQISTRFLPKLPDWIVRFCFNLLLVILAIYMFTRSWYSYRMGHPM